MSKVIQEEKYNQKPKPCPFCGTAIPLIKQTKRYPRYGKHAGEAVQAFTVVCRNRECVIYDADNKYWLSEQDAVKAWNKREMEAGDE